MLLQKDQFPITMQAYEITGDREIFIAEQVVTSQAEIDTFSNKYVGKLIKAKALSTTAAGAISTTNSKRKSSAATIWLVILIILILLIAIGFYTGWIQRTTGIFAFVGLPYSLAVECRL
ncbi:MAG: hypothetical protein JWQ40_4314 [Segetibacter sp.]|nr:hypothetical protein [Segetibacter sp.]